MAASAPLIPRLAAEGPVVTDGAWGTQLQARGLSTGEQADFWNLTHPERVEEVARSYAEAGSRIVLTNTFQANRVAARKQPEVDRIAEVNRAGVEISRRGAGERALVFASMGPTGKMLMMGDTSEAEIHEALGQPAEAARHYAAFVEMWRNADPELQPIVDDIKSRIASLVAER